MIDIHTHLHPPRLFAAIRRWFAERSPWELGHQPSEPGAVAAVMRAAGVECFVYCSYAHKPGMARELNDWLVATAATLEGFGIPLATVHPDDPDPLGDLQRALAGGCAGLKVHEDVQRVALDDPRLAPVLAELAASGAFVLVHAGPIPWRAEPGSGVARIARVLAAHPGLNVVVAHFGAPDTAAYFGLMPQYPRLHLDTTMALALASPMHVDASAATVAAWIAAHPDRVLYGTDFPNIPYAYGNERRGIEALGLAPGVLRAVLHDNAERLLARAGALPATAQARWEPADDGRSGPA